MIDLSVIIVSWNVQELLARCLESILNGPQLVVGADQASPSGDVPTVEIIVVDSASEDGSPEMVTRRFPSVRLITLDSNIGFSAANNIGLEIARGRYLMLLNPDTEVIGDALPRMIRFLDENPDVGVVGPQTLNPDGTHQSTRRRFPTLWTAFFESTWIQNLAPRRLLDRYYVRDVPDDATADVDWVQGSALMTRREVYETVGGLDEGFVMYSEEMDWCRRIKDAGWRVVYLGTAKIVHYGGRSSGQVVARSHIYFQQSKVRYFRKYHGKVAAEALRLYLLAHYAIQMMIEGVKWALRHKPAMRRRRVAAYWQVLRSGLRAR